MKNIFLFISILFSLAVSAQSTTARLGGAANTDNTYRRLNYKQVDVTDAAGLDTITLVPKNFHTLVRIPSLVDSVTLYIPSTAFSYAGDEVELVVTNSSTGKCVRFSAANLAPATVTVGSQNGTMYVTASKRAVISFVFDGVKWVERSRMVQ